MTRHPGLSPLRVEKLITAPLEESIRETHEVDEIRPTSMPGRSIIHVALEYGQPELEALWQELGHRVAAAEGQLAAGTKAPVVNDDFSDVAVVTAALTSVDFTLPEIADYAEHVQDRLYALPGTAWVDLLGVSGEHILIQPDDAPLAALGLSTDALVASLAEQNVLSSGSE